MVQIRELLFLMQRETLEKCVERRSWGWAGCWWARAGLMGMRATRSIRSEVAAGAASRPVSDATVNAHGLDCAYVSQAISPCTAGDCKSPVSGIGIPYLTASKVVARSC